MNLDFSRGITYACCFCGETCEWDFQVYLTRAEEEQMWPCHFECFSDAIVEQAREFREEWEAEGGDTARE
jgi:hypothetical protein